MRNALRAGAHLRRCLFCTALFYVALLAVSVGGFWQTTNIASAASGKAYVAPPPQVKPKSGLRAVFDTHWVNGYGYRPVTVEISDIGGLPMKSDRSFRIELSAHSWGETRQSAAAFMDVAAGSMKGTKVLLLPQEFPPERWSFRVYEDGRHLKDLDLEVATGGSSHELDSLCLLFIDRDAPTRASRRFRQFSANERQSHIDNLPNILRLADSLPIENAGQARMSRLDAASRVVNFVDTCELISLLPPQDLPDQWLGYSCFDMAFISWDDLQWFQEQHPQRWAALRHWVASGSTLIVFGVGDDFGGLSRLEGMLAGSNPDSQEPETRDVSLPVDSWLQPLPAHYGLAKQLLTQYDLTILHAELRGVSPGDGAPALTADRTPPQKAPFRYRTVGLGTIAAFASPDALAETRAEEWGWMLNSRPDNEPNWSRRHGLTLNEGNRSFWDFLIPDVGLPPINMFRVLITLFVLVIGPLNYHLLRRWRRLHLLLITVPAGAGLVTLALIAYAIAADGLHTRVRLRSLTHIDQRLGHAVSWSRQSYYAGLAPSGGMTYGADTAVYSIKPDYDEGERERRSVEWQPQRQQLVRGYITSRWTKQFLAVRSRNTNAQLDIQKDAAGNLALENFLRTDIEFLVVVDADGKIYTARNVKAGDKFQPRLQEDAADAVAELRKQAIENRPHQPERLPAESQYAQFRRRQRIVFFRDSRSDFNVNFGHSILEKNLKKVGFETKDRLQPKTYIAIVPHSPEVPIGISGAYEDHSFHVIEGSW